MKRLLTVAILLATVAMVLWGISKPLREKLEWKKLLTQTSDTLPISRTIDVLGDDWLGYLVLRSPEFQRRMAEKGIRSQFRMEPDFDKRIRSLREGTAQFIVLTLDSYLVNGGKYDWPGAMIFVIDESFGGDALVAKAEIQSVDDLNQPAIRGAFVGDSPSEFLLKSTASHFQLQNLKPRLPSMRVATIEAAYQALAAGKVDFAVLWEPLVTKAIRDIPGAHTLFDTKQAQGIVIDVALASRRVLAEDPELADIFTRAYFATLHELMANPERLKAVAAADAGKPAEQAANMLAGIKLATFDDNADEWLRSSPSTQPRLAESLASVQRTLADYGQRAAIPMDDPMSLLTRQVVQSLAAARTDIPQLAVSSRPNSSLFAPLSSEEWDRLSKRVRGTLLDEPITFRPGSTEIPEDLQQAIRDAVPKLAHYPTYRILIEAHVAPSANPEADLALSEERAIAVKRLLMWECHVPEERLFTIGAGGSQPPQRIAGESQTAWERRARRARIILVGE